MLYFLFTFIYNRYTLADKNLGRPVLIIKPNSLIHAFCLIDDNFTVYFLIFKIIEGIPC